MPKPKLSLSLSVAVVALAVGAVSTVSAEPMSISKNVPAIAGEMSPVIRAQAGGGWDCWWKRGCKWCQWCWEAGGLEVCGDPVKRFCRGDDDFDDDDYDD